MKRFTTEENGMLIVEATIVFPTMFLVIFLMLFAGNAYLQKCRVDSYVNQLAIEGASYCADPLLERVVGNDVPGVSDLNVYPYRFFDPDGAKNIQSDMQVKAEKMINNMSTGLFSGMTPENQTVTAKYHNGFIYSTFSIDVEYEIIMPVRLLGDTENIRMYLASHANMPVADTAEFIRNVDMVEDYMEVTGVKQAIDETMEKLKGMINEAKEWFS